MILVDAARGSAELQPLLQRYGLHVDKEHLQFADAMFEGYGPDGLVGIGVERKRLQDMINCIHDARYTGHQRVGMERSYRFNFLVIEGLWRPEVLSGLMLFGHPKKDGTTFWSDKSPAGDRVMYHTFRRYLFSVSLARVVVLFTRDITHTCYDIHELYHYFQKEWRKHTSLLAMHKGNFWEKSGRADQLMVIPTLDRKPPLVRRWAAELEGIGVKKSEDAARLFRTPRTLALSEELDWMRIPGVGVETAQSVIRQIGGGRK